MTEDHFEEIRAIKENLKEKSYYEDHSSIVDLVIGAGIGAGTGVSHYWDHFLQDENLYKLYDGIINTGIHTIIGAVILWTLHRYVFKTKKK